MTLIASPNPVVIAVRQSANGRSWSNVWYFHCPGTVSGEARVVLARDDILPAVINFTRRMLIDDFVVDDAYIGDATEQPPPTAGGTTSYYTRVTIGQAGLITVAGSEGAGMLPFNSALRLRLDTGLMRPGFKYLRGALGDADVKPGGPKGIQFQDATTRTAYESNVQAALAAAPALNGFFEGGALAGTAILAVPRYIVTPPSTNRVLLRMNGVVGIHVADVSDRSIRQRWHNRRGATEV